MARRCRARKATLEAYGAELLSNVARTGSGGALYLGFRAQLRLNGVLAMVNRCAQSGGFMYVDAGADVQEFSNANCSANKVSEKHAKHRMLNERAQAMRGGIAYLGGGGELLVADSSFAGSSASTGGACPAAVLFFAAEASNPRACRLVLR